MRLDSWLVRRLGACDRQALHRGRRHEDEDDRRDKPQHEDVLGDRQVDAGNSREMNQRVIERAVGNVIDDRLTGIESLGCGVTAAL